MSAPTVFPSPAIRCAGFIQDQTMSRGPTHEAITSGRKRSASHLNAASPCSNCRRSTVDHIASKMWWIRTSSSMPIAIAVQNDNPTSQPVATTWAGEKRSPSAVTAVPAIPIPSARPGATAGAEEAGNGAAAPSEVMAMGVLLI